MIRSLWRHTAACLLLATWTLATAIGAPVKPSVQTTPVQALESYLGNDDRSYTWELVETEAIGQATVYNLRLTSQVWQGITWRHQLIVIVPYHLTSRHALLMITGGSLRDGQPNWHQGATDELIAPMADIAVKNSSVAAIVRQVPNQPLFDSLTEDALIAYTLMRCQKEKDLSWPLLFPMTKSAIRAMDAVTEFCAEQRHHSIEGFVVTGASKRGWTTWLTAANDPRVRGAAPMVIDMLNMPVSIPYQIKSLGGYSDQIGDYSGAGILQQLSTDQGRAFVAMIDPYSYRRSLTMPKLLLMGTNDPYWATDNVKNYIDSIPSTNRLHYIANAGHGLGNGTEAFNTLGGFFADLFTDEFLPDLSWKAKTQHHDLLLTIQLSADRLSEVKLWSADAPSSDFRKATWEATPLKLTPRNGLLHITIPLPNKEFRAQYIDLTFLRPDRSTYTLSTRIFITQPNGLR